MCLLVASSGENCHECAMSSQHRITKRKKVCVCVGGETHPKLIGVSCVQSFGLLFCSKAFLGVDSTGAFKINENTEQTLINVYLLLCFYL